MFALATGLIIATFLILFDRFRREIRMYILGRHIEKAILITKGWLSANVITSATGSYYGADTYSAFRHQTGNFLKNKEKAAKSPTKDFSPNSPDDYSDYGDEIEMQEL